MEVTERNLYEIFIENDDEKVTMTEMIDKVVKKLSVEKLVEGDVEIVNKSFRRYKQNKKRRYADKRLKVDFHELKMSVDDQTYLFKVEVTVPKKKVRKSLDNLNHSQEERRTEEIWNEVKSVAAEENIDVSKVLGLLLTRCDDSNIKAIERKILNFEVPVITALTTYCDCNLGMDTYTKQRRLLKVTGFPIFPAWQKVCDLQSQITLDVAMLPAPYQDVYFPFLKALEHTTIRLFASGKLKVDLSCDIQPKR